MGYFGDDLDMLLAARAQAGMGAQSEMEMLARMRAQQEVLGATNGSSSMLRGTLGNTVDITSGAPPVQVINWTGEKSEIFTISITPLNAPTGASTIDGQVYRPYAEIQWGHRAPPAIARVDVCKGLQLTLGGSAVVVNLGVEAAAPAYNVKFSSWAAFGNARQAAPVTKTIYVDSLGSGLGNAVTLVIPNFARKLWPIIFTGATMTMIIAGLGGPTFGSYALDPTDNPMLQNAIALPNDAYAIVLNNTGAGATINARLVFELGL